MRMDSIVPGRSTACGNGGSSTMFGWVLPQSCMLHLFCCTLVSFVSGGKLGIRPMDLALVYLTPCGHKRKPLEMEKKEHN